MRLALFVALAIGVLGRSNAAAATTKSDQLELSAHADPLSTLDDFTSESSERNLRSRDVASSPAAVDEARGLWWGALLKHMVKPIVEKKLLGMKTKPAINDVQHLPVDQAAPDFVEPAFNAEEPKPKPTFEDSQHPPVEQTAPDFVESPFNAEERKTKPTSEDVQHPPVDQAAPQSEPLSKVDNMARW